MRWIARHVRVAVASAAAIAWAVGSGNAAETILVKPDAVDPAVFHTTTGERVDFVNQSGGAVHVEFKGDVREHRVVQIPATGPIWVVFHRSGTHPYEIHFYGPKKLTLTGLVNVTDDPQKPSEPSLTCGIAVMGACLEE